MQGPLRAHVAMSIATASVLVVGAASAAQQPPRTASPNTPADLSAVIALLKSGEATDLQKKQLIGKWYTGTVEAKEVRADRPSGPAQLVVAVKEESRGNQDNFIEMAFEIPDVERATKLRKRAQIVATGQLVGMSIRRTEYMHIGDVEVFQFRNVTLAEP